MDNKATKVINADGTAEGDDEQGFRLHGPEELVGREVNGLTVYRGVVLLTEEAPEASLQLMIDELMPAYRGRLVLICKEGPMLSMVWRGRVPEDMAPGKEVKVPRESSDAESWTVERATQVA
jgi:hypothetical protein